MFGNVLTLNAIYTYFKQSFVFNKEKYNVLSKQYTHQQTANKFYLFSNAKIYYVWKYNINYTQNTFPLL